MVGAKAHEGAGGQLGGQIEVMRGHAGDDGVAAGEGVIGQKKHGLAVGGHLQCAQGRAFAGQLLALEGGGAR